MEIKEVRVDDEITHLALSGKLDVAGEQQIGDEFKRLTSERGKPVLLDMAEVTYLASLGIRLLFVSAKALAVQGKKMVVLNPQSMVEETLQTSGTVGLIPIARDIDEAMGLAAG
jgi:anti-anti-sigma factor